MGYIDRLSGAGRIAYDGSRVWQSLSPYQSCASKIAK
jgi:hypothetical protein